MVGLSGPATAGAAAAPASATGKDHGTERAVERRLAGRATKTRRAVGTRHKSDLGAIVAVKQMHRVQIVTAEVFVEQAPQHRVSSSAICADSSSHHCASGSMPQR